VTTAPHSYNVRAFVDSDDAMLATLVESNADPLYAAPSHGLHGVAQDGRDWSRTLIAEVDGRLVAAVTAARNQIHPGRFILAVEVAAEYRQRGIAGALLDEVGRLRPEPLAFSAKIRPTDAAAMSLLRSRGGDIYQHCPGFRPDPTSAQIAGWCRDQVSPDSIDVVALADFPEAQRAELWVQQYLWVHEDWSPAAAAPLRELAPELVAEADPEVSVVTTTAGTPQSVTWAFPETDGSLTIVSETVARETPEGMTHVAVGLARCLQHLAETSADVELDGHRSDPHLSAVAATLPAAPAHPLLLVEWTPTRGAT
jgi:ribosomal protein S18 acetylase RimI-like enzyme